MVGAAGGLALVVLGVIIVIITKNDRVTIDTENGTTTVAVGKTVGGSDDRTVIAGSTENSRVSAPPSAAVAPASTRETVAAASGVGSTPVTMTPATEQGAAKALGPTAPAATGTFGFTNSIDMKFVLIPAGEFMMGSPESDEVAGPEEKPQHRVRISAFCLGATEVTQAQYQAVMKNNPSYFSSTGGGKDRVAGRATDQFPVENVSWLDAALFCNALSVKEGFTPFYQENAQRTIGTTKGLGYRLPTEAEWEYACRAGTTTRYFFGNDPWVLSKYARSEGGIHPVGGKEPNPWGLHDMYANVWEWCSDWYNGEYYKLRPSNDPTGPGMSGRRVERGGSSESNIRAIRSASRSKDLPETKSGDVGFRVALGQDTAVKGLRLITSSGKTLLTGTKTPGAPDTERPIGLQTAMSKTDLPGNSGDRAADTQSKPVATAPRVSKNTIGMQFALIPDGEFLMGSPVSDLWAEENEKPQHRVRIAQPFYLGVHEVTQREYQAVTAESPSSHEGDNLPVHNVSWKDAIEFCNALSNMEGRKPYYRFEGGLRVGGDGYRLPTEAEWEYACRAGNKTRYFFGENSRDLGDYAWTAANSGRKPHPVGHRRPNAFGLYDMLVSRVGSSLTNPFDSI